MAHEIQRDKEKDIGKIKLNRVAGGFSPPAPTPPGMRVRTGRFAKIPGRSRENDRKTVL